MENYYNLEIVLTAAYWATVELNIAAFCGSLATLSPLVRLIVPQALSSFTNSTGKPNPKSLRQNSRIMYERETTVREYSDEEALQQAEQGTIAFPMSDVFPDSKDGTQVSQSSVDAGIGRTAPASYEVLVIGGKQHAS